MGSGGTRAIGLAGVRVGHQPARHAAQRLPLQPPIQQRLRHQSRGPAIHCCPPHPHSSSVLSCLSHKQDYFRDFSQDDLRGLLPLLRDPRDDPAYKVGS